MRRLSKLFRALADEQRCGVIAYVTCGDPDAVTTVEIVDALLGAGADAIELGVPFSDPIADGPVIQAASQRALESGTTIDDLFRIATQIRATHAAVPLIAFSYLNPVLSLGRGAADPIEPFAARAAAAGIDALLLTDLPPESSADMRRTLHRHGVGLVPLLSPTSSPERVRRIDRVADGFVYYVSTTGVTGARRELDPELIEKVRGLRRELRKPIAVGFGVSTHAHYEALSEVADAVVIGSAIVRAIAGGDSAGAAERAAEVVASLRGVVA